jgi:hypothetical protein
MDRRHLIALMAAGAFLLSAWFAAGSWLTDGFGLRWPTPAPEPIVMPLDALVLGDAWPKDVDMCFWSGGFCFNPGPPTGRLVRRP